MAGLIIENTKIDFLDVCKKLIVGSFTTDSSINSFTSVNIKYTESSPGATLNIHSNSIFLRTMIKQSHSLMQTK